MIDHKEITAEEYDKKSFNAWWSNEAADKLLTEHDPMSAEQYLIIYNLAETAWLNGAYKAREFNW